MSGLAAIFHRDQRPVEQWAVAAMLAAAPYRGPDGMRIHLEGALAFGHAKMAVTPEDGREQQPLLSPRSGCLIIADARLDNRADLLARLPGAVPPATGDGDLILRAYETWGVDAAAELLGDFAFLIWDPRRRRLVGARDTSGQRTLFYRVDPRIFAAASEIQQLLQDPAVPIRPNEACIRDFLVPRNVFRNEKDQAATFYEGIEALPAGHALLVDAERLELRPYWSLAPGELRYRDPDDYAEHYRALLFEVVAARLRSAGPVGALLSGGLDSSSLVCTAQDLYNSGAAPEHGFLSFSLIYDGLECDEQELIGDIEAKYGFAAQHIRWQSRSGRLRLDSAGFLEGPNLGVRETRDAVGSAAVAAGVRVLITGDIADSCVGGSRLVFDSLLRRGDLAAFRRHLRAFRRLSDEPLLKILLFAGLGPLLPPPLQRSLNAAYLHLDYRRNGWRWLPAWMPAALRDELRRRHLQLSLRAERGRRFSSPAREAEFDLLYPPEISRHPAPWPLEMSRPFADRRLHEFLLAIPPEQKFEPHPDTDEFYAGSKQLVRRGMRGILPERIRTRTSKTVFQSTMPLEIDRQWPLYEVAFGPTAHSEIAVRGYVEQGRFWLRLQELRAGSYGSDLVYVLGMVGLETWLRALTQPRPQAVTVAPATDVAIAPDRTPALR